MGVTNAPIFNTMQNTETHRLHIQTLAELNYCGETARRDAAYDCLCNACSAEWPESHQQRGMLYGRCVMLINAVIAAAERSVPVRTKPRQVLSEKPLLHLLNLIKQQIQTLNSIAEHVHNVSSEAELLAELLGVEIFHKLEETCRSFDGHERAALKALNETLGIGKELMRANTLVRKSGFAADDLRRYNKAYDEYKSHYSEEATQ